jgi:hypothetical protein
MRPFIDVSEIRSRDGLQPKQGAADGDDGDVVSQGLFVSSRKAASLLEPVERAFDRCAKLILLAIPGQGGDAIGFGWDDGLTSQLAQLCSQSVAIVGSVSQQTPRLTPLDQRGRRHDVVPLALGDLKIRR